MFYRPCYWFKKEVCLSLNKSQNYEEVCQKSTDGVLTLVMSFFSDRTSQDRRRVWREAHLQVFLPQIHERLCTYFLRCLLQGQVCSVSFYNTFKPFHVLVLYHVNWSFIHTDLLGGLVIMCMSLETIVWRR